MTGLLPAAQLVATNGIKLATHRAGAGDAVLLLHGFPATAISLRHQFDALVAAGFDAIAPDQRGFGGSDCPAEVAAYRMSELVADLTGLLDALGVTRAWVVGHDWGGGVAWQLALRAPERVIGVVSLGTILFPRPDAEPIAGRRAAMGSDNYVVAFQEPGRAEVLLERDVGATIDFMYRRNYLTLAQFEQAAPEVRRLELLNEFERGDYAGDPGLTPAERAEMVAAFQRTGFGPGVNWYRNITWNWHDAADRTQLVTQPALIISGADDYLSPPAHAAASQPLVADLALAQVPGGHWFPLEYPEQTNTAMLGWLRSHS